MRDKIIQTAKMIFEMKCPEVEGFTSDSTIVDAWAKKYDVPKSIMALFWRRAELLAGKSTKCKTIPYAIATDIFKASVKKYLSKCDETIKYSLDNPIIDGKDVNIHYNEAKKFTLKDIIEQYKEQVKQLEQECGDL